MNLYGSLPKRFRERYSTLTSNNRGLDAVPYGTCSVIFYLDFFKQKRILKTQRKCAPSDGVSVVGRRI